MKLTRKTLLLITAGLGVLIIVYSLLRHFNIVSPGEQVERYFMDIVIFAALGLFLYNRKLASDDRKAREAAEQERLLAEQEPEEETETDDEDLPHWERKKAQDSGCVHEEENDDNNEDGSNSQENAG
jgi:hypothetical protein